MRKITFFMFLFATCICFIAKAQHDSPYTRARKYSQAVEFSVGYLQSNFLNENFRQNLEKEAITRSTGAIFRTRVVYYPILVDAEWFSSSYDINKDNPVWQNYTFSSKNRMRHRGANIALSFVLIPTSKYITPYAGLGYQIAELGMLKSILPSDDEKDKKSTSSSTDFMGNVKMNTPFWKAGIMITPHPAFGISAEYRHSIGLDQSRAFNQLCITLNWRRPTGLNN